MSHNVILWTFPESYDKLAYTFHKIREIPYTITNVYADNYISTLLLLTYTTIPQYIGISSIGILSNSLYT